MSANNPKPEHHDANSWEAKMEKLLEKCNSDNEKIMQCLTGDALKGVDGLVHVVKRVEDNTQQLRKQVDLHAARLDGVEVEVGKVKTQRKVILGLLTAGGTGFGAAVAKLFGSSAAVEEVSKQITK